MKTMAEDYALHIQCTRCFARLNKGFEVSKNVPAAPLNFPSLLNCCWCGGTTLVQYPNGAQASQGYQVREHIAKVPCQGRGGVHLGGR
jgi:hypothetical protein